MEKVKDQKNQTFKITQLSTLKLQTKKEKMIKKKKA